MHGNNDEKIKQNNKTTNMPIIVNPAFRILTLKLNFSSTKRKPHTSSIAKSRYSFLNNWNWSSLEFKSLHCMPANSACINLVFCSISSLNAFEICGLTFGMTSTFEVFFASRVTFGGLCAMV